jgi:hypothetical protein
LRLHRVDEDQDLGVAANPLYIGRSRHLCRVSRIALGANVVVCERIDNTDLDVCGAAEAFHDGHDCIREFYGSRVTWVSGELDDAGCSGRDVAGQGADKGFYHAKCFAKSTDAPVRRTKMHAYVW